MNEKLKHWLQTMKKDSFLEPSKIQLKDDKRFLRFVLISIAGSIILMGLIMIFTLLVATLSEDETMMPDVVGFPLMNAQVELQNKGLNTRLRLLYTGDPTEKGKVMDQSPKPGTLKKVESVVTLTVSRGSRIDKVPDYIGRLQSEVKAEVDAMGLGGDRVIVLKDPIYRYFQAPAGTVLEQNPKAGSNIDDGGIELTLVISQGPEEKNYLVDDWKGLNYTEMLQKASRDKLHIVVELSTNEYNNVPLVVSQTPKSGDYLGEGDILELKISQPSNIKEGSLFGIFEHQLNRLAVPLEIELISSLGKNYSDSGVTLYQSETYGGLISLPYYEAQGRTLSLVVGDTLIRQIPVAQ